MKLEELKTRIINNTLNDDLLILCCDKSFFVAKQYYRTIANNKGLKIRVIDSLDEVLGSRVSLFKSDLLNIYFTKEFKTDLEDLSSINNLIIICSTIDKTTKDFYNSFIIHIPALEEWQLKDYVYSNLEGVDTKSSDWLIAICNNNIERIDTEICKITSVPTDDRQHLFEQFKNDKIFGDACTQTIFNLTNAIIHKNYTEIINAYSELYLMDSNPMGFYSILYNGFKNVINIQLDSSPTPESCGLKPAQFWAIRKNNIGFYDRDTLLNIFNLLTSIDKEIKLGNIDVNMLIDYLLVAIFTI